MNNLKLSTVLMCIATCVWAAESKQVVPALQKNNLVFTVPQPEVDPVVLGASYFTVHGPLGWCMRRNKEIPLVHFPTERCLQCVRSCIDSKRAVVTFHRRNNTIISYATTSIEPTAAIDYAMRRLDSTQLPLITDITYTIHKDGKRDAECRGQDGTLLCTLPLYNIVVLGNEKIPKKDIEKQIQQMVAKRYELKLKTEDKKQDKGRGCGFSIGALGLRSAQ